VIPAIVNPDFLLTLRSSVPDFYTKPSEFLLVWPTLDPEPIGFAPCTFFFECLDVRIRWHVLLDFTGNYVSRGMGITSKTDI